MKRINIWILLFLISMSIVYSRDKYYYNRVPIPFIFNCDYSSKFSNPSIWTLSPKKFPSTYLIFSESNNSKNFLSNGDIELDLIENSKFDSLKRNSPLEGEKFNSQYLFDSSATQINSKYIFNYKQLKLTNTFDFNPFSKKINYYKLSLITIGTATSVAILHNYQSKAWWQATRTKFHFQNDWDYALWIDKLGHWWGATAIQHIFSSSLSWSNFSDETSVILGSILAVTYQLYVETYDGYASNWGFSPGDAFFDFGGAFYPLVQYYFPSLKNVNLKLSYFPSKRLLNKSPYDTLYKNKFVIDDYEGQSFYLSLKVNNFLPEKLEKFWPDFLCLAIGYQMRNWNGYAKADKNFYLALDYDLEQIPIYGQFWQFLKKTFNLFHLPAPAIKFSNKKISFTIAY